MADELLNPGHHSIPFVQQLDTYPTQDVEENEVLLSFHSDAAAQAFRDWFKSTGVREFREFLSSAKG